MRRWLLACGVVVASCDSLFGLDKIAVVDAPPPPPMTCPASYTAIAGSFYRFVTEPLIWIDAEQACEADGPYSHLAVLGDDPSPTIEVMKLYEVAHRQLDDFTWIGLTDRLTPSPACASPETSAYQWVTAESAPALVPHQLPWSIYDPAMPCDERCVRILMNNAAMTSASCSNKTPYMCECDGHAADPARY